MTEKIYKVQLLVDVYYKDPEGIVDKTEDENDVVCMMQDTVLNIVDHAEDEGLLQPDCGIELITLHSVVSDPTSSFVDELPVFEKEESDGLQK